jgi:uncharacterized membrane protein
MNQHLKLILVGTTLLVFGVTLVITSSFKIYHRVATIAPTAGILTIPANSSSDFSFWNILGPLPKSDQILIIVAESPELQNLLDPALNYNSTMKNGQNITISIVSNNKSISASVKSGRSLYWGLIVPYTFDIPNDWTFYYVRISNPESYPVCWIVNVILFGHVIDTTWLTVTLLGIIPIILGIVLVGVAKRRRNGINKQET